MAFQASTHLNVALVATALGFGLIGGPVALIARVVAVIFFARFVVALFGGATPAIWTDRAARPNSFSPHHPTSTSLPHEKQ